MALVCTKLTNHALDTAHLAVNNFILPYNPQDEKSVRTIVRNFLKKHENDKINVFAHQEKDKLGNLVILKQECTKKGIELQISLYCKNTDPKDEEFGQMMFREVDLNLNEDLEEMLVW